MIEASSALFRATDNKVYFKKVKIVVPSTWKSVTVDQPATNENFEVRHSDPTSSHRHGLLLTHINAQPPYQPWKYTTFKERTLL